MQKNKNFFENLQIPYEEDDTGTVVASGMNNCHGCGEYSRLSDLTAAAKLAQALMQSRE